MHRGDSRLQPRYPFTADIDVTDMQSGTQIKGRVKDLSLSGCGVNAAALFAKGTRVRIKLFHGGGYIPVLGTVIYGRQELGMGIMFTTVEPEDQRILAGWIAELTSIPMASD